eukprot:CAMPEP_0178768812 /NCGR_PEP_ID=MMETSP0744-20121128/20460_1 /TAXON_ID=913974 /ORGANISM="Nitzschia punctata, Strain CCMP561" /LENGTH=308 /DNA_ID=CAMNT_0020424951 /DNA_START=29 /DNA_END=953 /DNA_ORIENTATION=-
MTHIHFVPIGAYISECYALYHGYAKSCYHTSLKSENVADTNTNYHNYEQGLLIQKLRDYCNGESPNHVASGALDWSVGTAIFYALGPGAASSYRNFLIKGLAKLSKISFVPTNILLRVTLTVQRPFWILLHRVLLLALDSTVIELVMTQSEVMTNLFGYSSIHQLLQPLAVAPIVEEFCFRYSFHKAGEGTTAVLSMMMRIFWPGHDLSELISQDISRIFGYSPLVIASSLCFGLAHVRNHFPVDGTALETISSFCIENNHCPLSVGTRLFWNALLQTFAAVKNGLDLYAPLYETRGLVAAMGAHSVW